MEAENIVTESMDPSCSPGGYAVKEELEEENLNIKIEADESNDGHEEASIDNENPFGNVQLHVKQETTLNIEKETSDSLSCDAFPIRIRSFDSMSKKDSVIVHNMIPETSRHSVKEETITGDQFTPYEYPNYDDSMDSNEAVALTRVEACLQDDGFIKTEKLQDLIVRVEHLDSVTIQMNREIRVSDDRGVTETEHLMKDDQIAHSLLYETHPYDSNRREENKAAERSRLYRERHRDEINRRRRETRKRKLNRLTKKELEKSTEEPTQSQLSFSLHIERQQRYYERHKEEINKRKRDSRVKKNVPRSSPVSAAERNRKYRERKKEEINERRRENIKEDFYKLIKDETDLTVTETHLISNKLINTTSTITNPRDGIIESQTTKTLVMEIRPMSDGNMNLKINNPEKILPTTDAYMDYDEDFQLNSITGNVLSLEQEAYGLLKTKTKKILSNRNHACPKCPNTYTKKYHLKKHLSVHDSIEKRALGILKGQKTRQQNRTKKLTLEHDEDDKPKVDSLKKEGYECTCGNIFRRRSRMETCLKSHNLYDDTASYPCMTCSKHFKSKEELAMHRKRFHRKRFPCKFCPTDYNTPKELFKHLQVHQKVQLMEYQVISEVVKGKQKLKCFMCSKTYSELSDLKSHVMDNHKEPYTCPRCKKTFSKIIDFGNHMKVSHPEVEGQSVLNVLEAFSKLVKAWKCDECGLQFHEADKLALHQIEKHSPELKANPQLQCPDCRRVFISQKGLTSHKRVHHSAESMEEAQPVETGIMCLECRKMCKDMNALTSHMRLHSPDRKYPCKFCDFRFATPEKRKVHAELHTGDMKYVCFICEYQCSSENRLKQHKVSLKHLNMKEFLLTGVPLVEEQSTSKQDKKKTLKKEERVVKKRKRERDRKVSETCVVSEVPCDICGDMFASESEMIEHKQIHPFIEFPNEDKPSRIFFK